MMMKELMERVGEKRFNLVKALAKDAITEIEQITKENIDVQRGDIVKDQTMYILPPYMIRLMAVKIYDEDTKKYHPINRIWETTIPESIS